MIYSLICEGSCNPLRPRVDGLVTDAVAVYRATPPMGDGALYRLQRGLVYTPHQPTGRGDAVSCVMCGTPRRYGNTV